MALFRRKREKQEKPELPELPPLPELQQPPELQTIPKSKELTKEISLPSLPHKNGKIDHEIVKQIINHPEEQKTSDDIIKPDISQKPLVREIDEKPQIQLPQLISPNITPNTKPQIRELQQKEKQEEKRKTTESQAIPTQQIPLTQSKVKKESLFIKVDDYKNAIEKLQEVKSRVMEIEKLLSEIKEVKAKEEIELQEWEKEINDSKSKLEKIDKILFSEI